MTLQNVSPGLPSAKQDAFGLLLFCRKSPLWWDKWKLFTQHNSRRHKEMASFIFLEYQRSKINDQRN